MVVTKSYALFGQKSPIRSWWGLTRGLFLSGLVASGVKPPEVLLLSLVAAQASGGFTLVWVGTGRLSAGVGEAPRMVTAQAGKAGLSRTSASAPLLPARTPFEPAPFRTSGAEVRTRA